MKKGQIFCGPGQDNYGRNKGVPNARKPIIQPVCYANEDLMNNFNNMMIRIKAHLFFPAGDPLTLRYLKPNQAELDSLTNKIMEALKKETEPTVHYYEE
jgi:hypothetical protein